jgi:hypothetical protein
MPKILAIAAVLVLWASAAHAQLIPFQQIPSGGGPVALSQKTIDWYGAKGTADYGIGFNTPLNAGDTVCGAALWEPPGGEVIDHVQIGNQSVDVTNQRYANARYVGDGLGMTTWCLLHAQGGETSVHYIMTGAINIGPSAVSVFSGLGPSATIDGPIAGAAYAPGGPTGSCCANGLLQSPPVTPSALGDLLYGAMNSYGNSNLTFGDGWNGSNSNPGGVGIMFMRDEWMIDNGTAPIPSTFKNGDSGTTTYATIIAIRP